MRQQFHNDIQFMAIATAVVAATVAADVVFAVVANIAQYIRYRYG